MCLVWPNPTNLSLFQLRRQWILKTHKFCPTSPHWGFHIQRIVARRCFLIPKKTCKKEKTALTIQKKKLLQAHQPSPPKKTPVDFNHLVFCLTKNKKQTNLKDQKPKPFQSARNNSRRWCTSKSSGSAAAYCLQSRKKMAIHALLGGWASYN